MPTPAKQSAFRKPTADQRSSSPSSGGSQGTNGTPQITSFPAHLVGLLSQKQQASRTSRADLAPGSGKETAMCYRQQDEYLRNGMPSMTDQRDRLVPALASPPSTPEVLDVFSAAKRARH